MCVCCGSIIFLFFYTYASALSTIPASLSLWCYNLLSLFFRSFVNLYNVTKLPLSSLSVGHSISFSIFPHKLDLSILALSCLPFYVFFQISLHVFPCGENCAISAHFSFDIITVAINFLIIYLYRKRKATLHFICIYTHFADVLFSW